MSTRPFCLFHVATPLLAVTALSCSPTWGQGRQVHCGLGPPPGTTNYAEHERKQTKQRTELGYLLVCEDNLRRYDYLARAKRLEEVLPRLAFKPVSLDATPFSQMKAAGGFADYFSDGRAAGIHRTFKAPAGRIIDLLEWDMSVSGGSVKSQQSLQTERVNDSPAQLTVVQTESGKAMSILSWVEGRRYYELSIDMNVSATGISNFIQLARSIPRSVPAK